ncbi:MAG: ATP-binding protein [Ktedonobacteraceae bacterium]
MTEDFTSNYGPISESLLEALPLPVFIVNRSLTILHYNQQSLLFANVTNQIKGSRLDQVIPNPAITQLVEASVRTGSTRKTLYEQGNSDVAWKVSVSPLAHQPHSPAFSAPLSYQYFAVIIEDMTETRHIERVQRDFLANISHELRTPLTSVRLLTETLEDTIDTDPERAQEFVEKIETEVQYLSELVAELLELSRIESGQMLMNIEPVGAARMVREIMARMLPLAQRHRVKLLTNIQQGDTLVAADSKQITRVLVNLVHNAIKFTPSGGTIVIGTARQEDQLTQRFYVSDTGVGIRAEELPRIFERFYKTDRARSKAGFIGPGGGGTGLGLAIARNVVETHSGRIMAESAPGKGSTFTFTLPVAVPIDDTDTQDTQDIQAYRSPLPPIPPSAQSMPPTP